MSVTCISISDRFQHVDGYNCLHILKNVLSIVHLKESFSQNVSLCNGEHKHNYVTALICQFCKHS